MVNTFAKYMFTILYSEKEYASLRLDKYGTLAKTLTPIWPLLSTSNRILKISPTGFRGEKLLLVASADVDIESTHVCVYVCVRFRKDTRRVGQNRLNPFATSPGQFPTDELPSSSFGGRTCDIRTNDFIYSVLSLSLPKNLSCYILPTRSTRKPRYGDDFIRNIVQSIGIEIFSCPNMIKLTFC